MWSEKRNIEGCMFMAIIPMAISTAISIIYFFNGGSLVGVNEVNSFSAFGVATCCLFNFLTKVEKISDDKKREIKSKMLG